MRLLLALTVAFSGYVYAEASKEISGTVTMAKGSEAAMKETGVLYVFARAGGGAGGPPAAVLKIPQPKFPVTFKLSAANAMMPGTPFDGPFTITARYSPTGDALDKSGPQGEDKRKDIKPGASDVKIELKK